VQDRTAPNGWTGLLTVALPRRCDATACPPSDYGSADLAGDQVRFDPALGTASVHGVPLTVTRTDVGPDGSYVTSSRSVTVSLVLTGTGVVTADQTRGDVCGSGDPCTTSVRHDRSRAATVELTAGDVTGDGTGTLQADHGTDVAPARAGRAS
jgi:hypothetical protein